MLNFLFSLFKKKSTTYSIKNISQQEAFIKFHTNAIKRPFDTARISRAVKAFNSGNTIYSEQKLPFRIPFLTKEKKSPEFKYFKIMPGHAYKQVPTGYIVKVSLFTKFKSLFKPLKDKYIKFMIRRKAIKAFNSSPLIPIDFKSVDGSVQYFRFTKE